MLILYTICHFLVDFGSGWALYHGAAFTTQGVIAVVLYSFVAFALQFPLGMLADVRNRNALIAGGGCMLVALACVCPLSPLAVASVAGFGNALFHLGAGIDVLNRSTGKFGPLGIFVSTGAFGIFYGCRLGANQPDFGGTCGALLLLAALAIIALQRRQRTWSSNNATFAWPDFSFRYVSVAICLFLVVVLRSYMGFALSFPWKSFAPWGTLALVALFAGKFCGGLLSDRFGIERTSVATLIAAALLFVASAQPWAGVGAVWLFNMTMPITLGALVAITPGCKGGAFGALTLGLFLGALPHLLDLDPLPHLPLVYTAITALSGILLITALRLGRALAPSESRQ